MSETRKTMAASPKDISRIAHGFQASRALLTGFELDVFTILDSKGKTPDQVAAEAGCSPRATDRLMRALSALGLLETDGERFSNTEASRRLLSRNSPECMSGLDHTAHTFQRWAALTRAVRTGEKPEKKPWEEEESARAFIEAMHARAKGHADDLARLAWEEGTHRVLDVGGGSGVYSMAFCRQAEGVLCTVFDLPEVTPLTREYVEREGYGRCIDAVEGNILEDIFPKGYDLVFISAIIHMFSPAQNRLLVAKAREALVPGGRVAVQDFVMDEDRLSPVRGTLFALNMLVGTDEGDTYTDSEIRSWLKDAGFDSIETVKSGPDTSMVIGSRPEKGDG